MTLLFQGHERDSFIASSASCTEITTAGHFDSSVSRCAVVVGTSWTDSIKTYPFSAVSDIWCKFKIRFSTNISSGRTVFAFRNGSAVAMLRLQLTSNNVIQLQYYNGSGYTNVGSTLTINTSTLYTFDVHIKGGASGEIDFYNGGTLHASGTGSYTSVANIVEGYWEACEVSAARVSAVICDTTSTLTHRTESEIPTSDGTDTGGTGGYADIDETPLSTADYLLLPANGDNHSFKSAARTQTLAQVGGVTVSGSLYYVAGGATKARPYLKIGGTRYYGTTFTLQTSAAPYSYSWVTNPATGIAWTSSDASDADLEWGWEAVT